MTAKLIRYIGFSLYNSLEIIFRGSGKLREFHYAKSVSTLGKLLHASVEFSEKRIS